MPLASIAWLYGPMAAGALLVWMTFFIMGLFLKLQKYIFLGNGEGLCYAPNRGEEKGKVPFFYQAFAPAGAVGGSVFLSTLNETLRFVVSRQGQQLGRTMCSRVHQSPDRGERR